MITRSNLAEQLREYQIRSKHDWASVSFFSSTSNLTSSRLKKVNFHSLGDKTPYCSGNNQNAEHHSQNTQKPIEQPYCTVFLGSSKENPHETWISQSDGQRYTSNQPCQTCQKWNRDGYERS
uniref:Uncharacterized protein n=1 Tax=Cannabis sativa TaxID=3483 RepID=A0A803QVN7_CANSA